MAKRFTKKIPGKPFLRRETYDIPETYVAAYRDAGITEQDALVMLFHLTQFGGFRLRRVPADLHIEREFVDRWFKHEWEGRYHTFKANAAFIDRFGALEIRPLQKRWRSIAVDWCAMFAEGFSDDEVKDAIDLLTELNEFYTTLQLDIRAPKSGLSAEDRIELSRFHGVPFLVKKPKAGGRLFHPETSYQRISSSLRPLLTINGERTSEIDLTAATMQFLNIALRRHALNSLDALVLSNGDPYQYFLSTLNSQPVLGAHTERPMEREALKTLLYTAIYSSESKQEVNVNRKLRLMGREYKHKDLTSFFPEFFGALTALRSRTGRPLHMVIYKEESSYAQRVLRKGCLEERIPVLPLHDSFIVPRQEVDHLRAIMDAVALELYERRLAYKQKY